MSAAVTCKTPQAADDVAFYQLTAEKTDGTTFRFSELKMHVRNVGRVSSASSATQTRERSSNRVQFLCQRSLAPRHGHILNTPTRPKMQQRHYQVVLICNVASS
jgi:hypothetical protein